MRPISIIIVVAGATVWAAAIVGFVHILRAHAADPSSSAVAIVGYSAAIIALASLMAHAWIAVRNSRKQHTMNVLLQTRLDQQFAAHSSKIQETFPEKTPITSDVLNKEENKAVRDGVVWILNFYEFIATGIRHGDLDEPLMRDCICTQFCTLCRRAEDIIKSHRHEDEFGHPSVARRRVLKSVRWLQRRWQRKIDKPLVPFWWPC